MIEIHSSDFEYQHFGDFDFHHLIADPFAVFGAHAVGHTLPQVAFERVSWLTIREAERRIIGHADVECIDKNLPEVLATSLCINPVIVVGIRHFTRQRNNKALALFVAHGFVHQTVCHMNQKGTEFLQHIQSL